MISVLNINVQRFRRLTFFQIRAISVIVQIDDNII